MRGMNAVQYIKERQEQWAIRKGLRLIGSKRERGEPRYTSTLDENLFEPLGVEAKRQIAAGDGKELGGEDGMPGKMQAVHSSSAIGVNVFHYWHRIGQVATIAVLCGLPASKAEGLAFERKFNICPRFRYSPNIDMVIHYAEGASQKVSAIECKFCEAYGAYGHGGLDPKYLDLPEMTELWNDIPQLKKLAGQISPEDSLYTHLHPAQLIKHILGLKREFGTRGFRLLYLWYDAFGEEGARHRREVEEFKEIAVKDKVRFQSMTYQELIAAMAEKLRDRHPGYVDYLTERYL
jgi:hypothetical protein